MAIHRRVSGTKAEPGDRGTPGLVSYRVAGRGHTPRAALLVGLLLAALFTMPTIASGYVTTTGGPVQAEPHVYEIYWGSNWNAEPAAAERGRLQTLYNDLSGSAYQGILTQYWSPNGFVSPWVTTASYTDTVHGAAPTNVTRAMMEAEVNEAIAANSANGWPQSPTVNDQFVLLMPPGSTYNPPNPSNCGFHSTTSAHVVFAWIDWGGTRCAMTVTGAHEYAEAVTDPYPSPFSNPFSHQAAWKNWYLESEGEVADLCAYSARGFLPGGIEVPSLWDNSINKPFGGCSLGHSNPPQVAPEIITEAATGVTGSKATLNGSVHPNGLQVQNWWYKYGAQTGCLCQETSHRDWGHGQENYSFLPETISENFLGTFKLEPGKTYRYQLVTETGEPLSESAGQGTGIRQFGPVREFTTVGVPAVTTSPAIPQQQPAGVATVGGTVNPRGVAAEYWVEFTTQADYVKSGWANASKQPVPAGKLLAGSSPVEVSQQLSGLVPETWYEFRLGAKNEAGTGFGNRMSFLTRQTTAATGTASQVGTDDMTLRGTVNPEGIATKYKFEYGTTALYGQSVPASPEAIGSGVGDVEVSQPISGLKANTNYYFRIVAESAAGVVIKGNNVIAKTLSSCKGAEGKCEWKVQSTPDLSDSRDHLDGVSCASASMCFAVGRDELRDKSPVERWNGSEWTTQFKPKGGLGYPADVSCPSTTMCVAAGWRDGAGPRAWLYKDEVGGWSSTTEEPPTPAGGSQAVLRSISCYSSTACTAVGTYYRESEEAYKLLIERWNGTSWSIQSAPNPSETSSFTEQGVSCASSSSCVIVGTYLKGNTSVSFAESWNGSAWSALPTQNPGAYATTLNDVSCSAAGACTAVGSYKEIKGQAPKPLAESWNGSAWSVMSVPSPAEATGNVTLRGISCTSGSACVAVGRFYLAGSLEKTLAESWDGTKWTLLTTVNPNAAINALNQVSCTAASACTAVGSGRPEVLSAEDETSIAERWNGGEWKTQATPSFETSEYRLEGVSCASASTCLAVGRDQLRQKARIERWNGSEWTAQFKLKGSQGYPADISCPTTTLCIAAGSLEGGGTKAWRFKEEGGEWTSTVEAPPVPAGGSKAILRSVSCSSSSACTAVGYYYLESEKLYRPLVERWNGATWSVQSAPGGPEGEGSSVMLSVSCPTAASCTTVGSAGSATFAERWTSAEGWTVMTPLSPGSLENSLEDVSCPTANTCVAVGTYKETGKGQLKKPLAESWNGSAWSLTTAPSPGEAKGDTKLNSVSCVASTCTAVGQYASTAGFAEEKTLTESWDGTKWVIKASPNSSQKFSVLSGVSCSSSIACTAVGRAQPEVFLPEGQTALAERYE